MTDDRDDLLFDDLSEMSAVLGPTTDRERAAAGRARDLLVATRTWDLAELAFDSLLDDAVAVRGPAPSGARQLEFDAVELTLRVEVTADLLVCRVEPAEDVELNLVTSGGESIAFRNAGGGVYDIAEHPNGAARLELHSATAHLVTSWIHL